MKSRLVISFGGVADRERKHQGKNTFRIKGARAPGRRIVRAILGRLAFGSSPLRALRRRIDLAFLGRPAFGPSPIAALVLGRLARGTGPGPMVPTILIFLVLIIFENIIVYKNYNQTSLFYFFFSKTRRTKFLRVCLVVVFEISFLL